jgi:predicted nucleic acid-binding protein
MYADSSFLVSAYLLDANTAAANQVLQSFSQALPYTALHRLEIRNAFALAVFRGYYTSAQIGAAWRNVEADVRARKLRPTRISWRALFRRAAQLAALESPQIGTRSLDILHVASAERIGSNEFVTFDRRQRMLAAKLGMHVRPAP